MYIGVLASCVVVFSKNFASIFVFHNNDAETLIPAETLISGESPVPERESQDTQLGFES